MEGTEEEWTVAKAIASLQAFADQDPKNAELKVVFVWIYDGEPQAAYITGFEHAEGYDRIELVEG